MSQTLEQLEGTLQLLERAFPSGVSSEQLPYLLKVFYEHLSDENLTIVFSSWLSLEEGFVHNEVYRSASIDPEDTNVTQAQKTLEANGFSEWLDEE